MSWLSKVTGVGINPLKGKVHIDPLKALATAATVGSFGALGPVAGAVTGALSHVPGGAATLERLKNIPGHELASGIWKGVKSHGDQIAAVGAGLYGAKQSAEAGKLRDRAVGTAQRAYDEREAVRQRALRDMMAEDVRLDLPSYGNPYAGAGRTRLRRVSL